MRSPICGFILLLTAQPALAQVPTYTTLELQARTNLPVNGPSFNLPSGSSFNSITVAINDEAQVAFKVQVLPGTNAAGIWFGGAGVGSIVCQSENVADIFITDVSLDNTPNVAYGQTFGNVDGLYVCDPAIPGTALVTALPLGTTSWGSPQLRDNASIGYRASFSSGRAWVVYDAGNAVIYAAEAAIMPGSGIGFLFTPAYSSTGRIAGKVQVLANGPVPQHDQIQLNDGAGSVTTLAITQVAEPGSIFSGFDNSVGINGLDQVAFIASRVGGGRGVYRVEAGQTPVEMARTGVDGLVEIEFFPPAINDSGLVVFRGRDANGQAIFVSDGSTLGKVVSQGDTVPSDLGPATIGQNDASPVFGGGAVINNNGDVAFTAALHPPGNNQIEWGSGVFVAYASVDKVFSDGFE
jgi:hypothetical protein